MKVNEVFHGIQGEGVHSNLPMTFIRLQGCNLYPGGCSYCDTPKARDPNGVIGLECDLDRLWKWIALEKKGRTCWWYCITGGEPLLQLPEMLDLVNTLKDRGIMKPGNKIEVETNGTLPPPSWFPLVNSWVVDIKCPSSGVESVAWNKWKPLMRSCDQVKFVVSIDSDLEFTKDLVKDIFTSTVLVSPVMFTNLVETNLTWTKRVLEFCLQYNLRFSPQIHKLVGVK